MRLSSGCSPRQGPRRPGDGGWPDGSDEDGRRPEHRPVITSAYARTPFPECAGFRPLGTPILGTRCEEPGGGVVVEGTAPRTRRRDQPWSSRKQQPLRLLLVQQCGAGKARGVGGSASSSVPPRQGALPVAGSRDSDVVLNSCEPGLQLVPLNEPLHALGRRRHEDRAARPSAWRRRSRQGCARSRWLPRRRSTTLHPRELPPGADPTLFLTFGVASGQAEALDSHPAGDPACVSEVARGSQTGRESHRHPTSPSSPSGQGGPPHEN